MQFPKKLKRALIETAVVFLILTVAAWGLSQIYHFSGPVAQTATQLLNPDGTPAPNSYAWTDPITNGTVFYLCVKNTGTLPVNATATVSNMVDCLVTPSWTTYNFLGAGQNASLTLLLDHLTKNSCSYDLTIGP